jgi:hypothetical protein
MAFAVKAGASFYDQHHPQHHPTAAARTPPYAPQVLVSSIRSSFREHTEPWRRQCDEPYPGALSLLMPLARWLAGVQGTTVHTSMAQILCPSAKLDACNRSPKQRAVFSMTQALCL